MYAEIKANNEADIARVLRMIVDNEKAIRVIINKSDDGYCLSISEVGDEIPSN
jgi:hypothetical protein